MKLLCCLGIFSQKKRKVAVTLVDHLKNVEKTRPSFATDPKARQLEAMYYPSEPNPDEVRAFSGRDSKVKAAMGHGAEVGTQVYRRRSIVDGDVFLATGQMWTPPGVESTTPVGAVKEMAQHSIPSVTVTGMVQPQPQQRRMSQV
jgi:hypothetical protein